MPSGQTTSNSMSSTNPALTSLFTSLFGGANGAGSTGVGALSEIASGTNIQQLNQALTQSSQQQTTQGTTNLKEVFGSTGMGSSSSLAKAVGTFQNQQSTALATNISQTDLQAQQQQLQAASYLTQIFSGAANNYYNNKTTSSNTGLDAFTGAAAGGVGDAMSIFSTLFA